MITREDFLSTVKSIIRSLDDLESEEVNRFSNAIANYADQYVKKELETQRTKIADCIAKGINDKELANHIFVRISTFKP